MTETDVTPAITVPEILAAQADQLREHARACGIAATEHRPLVEQSAGALTSARRAVEALEAQRAEIEAAIADARALHEEATGMHAEALGVLARHEKDGQDAADMADRLDVLARGLRMPPALPSPDRVLAETGLMTEPPKPVVPVAREEVWAHYLPPGDPRHVHDTDAAGNCRNAECDHLADELTAPGVVDSREQVAELVATHGPTVTIPDTGLAPPPLDPPPGNGVHRHAKPGLIARITGGHRVVDDAAVPDDLLAEGQRQARPDGPKEQS